MGPLDPPSRQTSIVVFTRRFNDTRGDYRIVTSISTRSSTEILEIQPSSGALHFATDHTFTDEDSATTYLNRQGFTELARGHALVGYTSTQTCAGILLATRVAINTTLPGNHHVYLISEAQWVLLPLDAACHPFSATMEQDFWRSIQQHTVSGVHYYSETVDLTRPFPSEYSPIDPLPEFVWNSWLSQPLRQLGLTSHCPVLLQGAIESSLQVHPTGQRYTIALITRRSRRHPGTRYLARGLNEYAGPGNEIEGELVLWTAIDSTNCTSTSTTSRGNDSGRRRRSTTDLEHTAGINDTAYDTAPPLPSHNKTSQNLPPEIHWVRVVWRRGTVPIWWGVELQPFNKGLQAEVYVREKRPYIGTLTYFRGLQRQSMRDCGCLGNNDDNDNNNDDERMGDSSENILQKNKNLPLEKPPSITCINLLHCNPKKAAELMLSSHFQESIHHVKEKLDHSSSLRLLNFDWHGTMNMLTEERGIEAFWHFIEQPVKQTGFAVGVMQHSNNNNDNNNTLKNMKMKHGSSRSRHEHKKERMNIDRTEWGTQWHMIWHRRQHGLLRFNCADSLDRTNAATCFAMLPVMQEGLRVLGIALDVTSAPTATVLHRSPLTQRMPAGDRFQVKGKKIDIEKKEDVVEQKEGEEEGKEEEEEEEEGEILPKGWERRQHAGRALYIDHIHRTTQWNPPPGTIQASKATTATTSTPKKGGNENPIMASSAANPSITRSGPTPIAASHSHPHSPSHTHSHSHPHSPSHSHPHSHTHSHSHTSQLIEDTSPGNPPWAFFSHSLESIRTRLYSDALSDYVVMFRKHGDIHSALYTGSPAMHSHVLGLILAPDARSYGSSASVGKLQNLRVAVQRRWNNTVSDSSRQQSIELFLGLNLEKHCPGIMFGDPPPKILDLSGFDDDDDGIGLRHGVAGTDSGDDVDNDVDVKGLHVFKHDGRVGVREDLANLEPLPAEPALLTVPSSSLSENNNNGLEEEEDDAIVCLDPLGAITRSSSSGGEKNAVVSQFHDLLL